MSTTCIGYYSPIGVGGSVPAPLAPGVAPSNVVAPFLYGDFVLEDIQPEDTIHVTNGIWEGSPVIAYTYQWYSGAVALTGETASSYTLDLGAPGAGGAISCRVTATNGAGSAYQQSNAVAGLDTDAMDWIIAEEGAGVSFTAPQKEAVATFYAEQKTSGVWALMRFLYPTWTGIAAGNAIDMVAQRTATFPAGMGHEPGYIVSDGLSQYMDTNYNFAANPVGSALSFGFLGVLPGANNSVIMQANNNPTNQNFSLLHALFNGPVLTRTGYVSPLEASLALASQAGIIVLSQSGTGANTLLAGRRTSSGYTLLRSLSSAAVTLTDTRNILCMATYANNSDVINTFNTVGRYGCFFCAEGLNSAQIESLTLGLKNLYETLTGLTIP